MYVHVIVSVCMIHVIVCLSVCVCTILCMGDIGCNPNIQFLITVAGGDDVEEEKEASATTVVFKGKAPVDTACKQKLTKVHYLHLA